MWTFDILPLGRILTATSFFTALILSLNFDCNVIPSSLKKCYQLIELFLRLLPCGCVLVVDIARSIFFLNIFHNIFLAGGAGGMAGQVPGHYPVWEGNLQARRETWQKVCLCRSVVVVCTDPSGVWCVPFARSAFLTPSLMIGNREDGAE